MHRLKLIAIASTVLLFAPLLFPLLTGRVFAFNDLEQFHLPFRFLYQQALRSGDSILWSPAVYSGYFVFGEGQVGMAHPLHYLLYRGLPLGVAFNLEIVLSYLVAAVGMRLWLGRLELSAAAAWFGALLFAFSGSSLLHVMHVNAVAVLAHTPWLLLAVHTLLTADEPRRRVSACGMTALLLASQVLLGHPQYMWISSVPIGVLVVVVAASRRRWRHLPLLVAALVLGALVGAIQLWPTFHVLQGSNHLAASDDFRFEISLGHWQDLRLFLAPERTQYPFFHEVAAYAGTFSTISFLWIGLRWRAIHHRALIVGCLLLAAVGVLLALGPNGGVYPWLAQLPGFGTFRAPARHIALVHLALSGLGAVVFDDLAGLVQRRESVAMGRLSLVAVAPLFAVISTIGGFSASGHTARDLFAPRLADNLDRAWPHVALLVALTLVVALAARRRAWALSLLAPLVALDLGVWGYGFVYRPHEGVTSVRTIDAVMASASAPPTARAGDVIFDPSHANLPLFRGLRQPMGYVGLHPALALDPSEPAIQLLAGVSWRYEDKTWKPVSDGMPRARLVSETRASVDVRDDVRVFDYARIALLDRAIDGLSGLPGRARVIRDRPGAIDVDTGAPGAQLLILTERYDDGWKVTVDGRPAEALRAYGQYLACEVPQGAHRVAFVFDPDSVSRGRVITAVALAVTLGLLWCSRRRSSPLNPPWEALRSPTANATLRPLIESRP